MGKRLPPLDSLRVLAACVRHGNFSRAAAELGITPTAVSQRIRTLEAQMGVELFRRRGPRLVTTALAKALGQRVEHALSLMRAAVEDCRRSKSPLRLTCAPTFAARWLLPRMAGYHALAGANIIALDTVQDILPPGSFDVAIRSGIGPWPDIENVKLLTETVTPMISPKLLPRRGRLTVRKLLSVPLLPAPQWPDWFKAAGLPRANPRYFATRLPNYELEAQAAVNGVGAALLSPVLYAELITQGTLVAPFPWTVECASSYWLLWTQESAGSHFVDWLRSQFGVAAAAAGSGLARSRSYGA
ncbi:MAG TPA: LysR substrate-binding domain-containing protein [Steroidobacteraceae bacterium]|nr:LysR substrate-binding domain-containing protein [Steroidobacteraceae bacterium]